MPPITAIGARLPAFWTHHSTFFGTAGTAWDGLPVPFPTPPNSPLHPHPGRSGPNSQIANLKSQRVLKSVLCVTKSGQSPARWDGILRFGTAWDGIWDGLKCTKLNIDGPWDGGTAGTGGLWGSPSLDDCFAWKLPCFWTVGNRRLETIACFLGRLGTAWDGAPVPFAPGLALNCIRAFP